MLLLAVAAVWGSSYLSVKVLTVDASVFAILATRFLIAAVLMVIVWGFQKDKKLPLRGVLVAVALGVIQALIFAIETWGVKLTSATNAGLIVSMAIVFTPILESVWLKRWLPRAYFIAATVSVVGVLLLVSEHGFKSPNIGDLLMLIAALLRALHVTAMGRWTEGQSYGTVTMTLIQTLVCAVGFLLLDLPHFQETVMGFNALQWLDLLYLAAACTVFAFLVTLWSVRRTSAARVSLLLGTEPVWAVLVGVTLGAEMLGWIGALGALLIIFGSYRAQAVELKHRLAS